MSEICSLGRIGQFLSEKSAESERRLIPHTQKKYLIESKKILCNGLLNTNH